MAGGYARLHHTGISLNAGFPHTGESLRLAAGVCRPLGAFGAAGSADVTSHLNEAERKFDVEARLGVGKVQVEDFPDAAEAVLERGRVNEEPRGNLLATGAGQVGGKCLDKFRMVLGVIVQEG